MGNCTATIKRTFSEGPMKKVIADLALSTSYAAGGDTVPLSVLGLQTVEMLSISGSTSPAALFHTLSVLHGATNQTAPKIMARDVGTGAEVTAATNLSTMVVRVEAQGEGPF
jgi:hypothetical protein